LPKARASRKTPPPWKTPPFWSNSLRKVSKPGQLWGGLCGGVGGPKAMGAASKSTAPRLALRLD
jgi:hypothetical protein